MRTLDVKEITEAVAQMARETNHFLSKDVKAKGVLEKIEENISIAEQGELPLCQDTGLACVFLEVGQDVRLIGGSVAEAIHEGARQGYQDGFLRKSVVKDPLRRVNTGDNTPAHIHYEIVPGDKVKVIFAPKGF